MRTPHETAGRTPLHHPTRQRDTTLRSPCMKMFLSFHVIKVLIDPLSGLTASVAGVRDNGTVLSILVVALGDKEPEKRGLYRSELTLVRSSLLYADRVRVLTSSSARALRQLSSDISRDRRGRRLRVPASLLQSIGKMALESMPRNDLESIVASAAVDLNELQSAVRAGIIERIEFGSSDNTPDTMPDEIIIEQVASMLSDPTIHAVFDSEGHKAIQVLSTVDGRVASARPSLRSNEAELGAGLISRLPAFPQAPLDELVDLKADLADPLTRYRAAVLSLESRLGADNPTEQLDVEIDDIWREKVAPAIVDLQEQAVEHDFVRELARAASTSARDLIISGASLSIALTAVGQVAAAVSAAAGLAGMAAQASAKALVERAARRRDMKSHDFYYLFRLKQAIGQR